MASAAIRGQFFYLHPRRDVFSRKMVGGEVLEQESTEHAATVVKKAHWREGMAEGPWVLHADNDSPMKGATRLATLQKLGVTPSFSRPSVSKPRLGSLVPPPEVPPGPPPPGL